MKFPNPPKDINPGTIHSIQMTEDSNADDNNDHNETPVPISTSSSKNKKVSSIFDDEDDDFWDDHNETPVPVSASSSKNKKVTALLDDDFLAPSPPVPVPPIPEAEKALEQACIEGDLTRVKNLMANSTIDVNYFGVLTTDWFKNEFNETPFFIACKKGHFEIVKYLMLDPRIEVNKQNYGMTPFFIACQSGHTDIIQYLMADPRIDINMAAYGQDDNTAFFYLCQQKNIKLIELLLKDPRIEVNKGTNKQSPFWQACKNKKIDVVKLLIKDARVNINQQNSYGQTPFEIAWKTCDNYEILKYLVADPRFDVNETQCIEVYGHYERETPFWFACTTGNSELVTLLTQNPKVDIAKASQYNNPPFFKACENGHSKIVKYLMQDPRIDVNQKLSSGKMPFFIACETGRIEVVKCLMQDPRIDINQKNNKGDTPFYIACRMGHIEIVKLLMQDPRIDINLKNNDGETPFSQADKIEIVKILLQDPRIEKLYYESSSPPRIVHFIGENRELGRYIIMHPKLSADDVDILYEYEDLLLTGMLLAKDFTSQFTMKTILHDDDAIKNAIKKFFDKHKCDDAYNIKFLRTIIQEEAPLLIKTLATMSNEHALSSTEVFLTVVFLCDDYLAQKPNTLMFHKKNALRFFNILKALPIELQMKICIMLFNYNQNFVLSDDVEKLWKPLLSTFKPTSNNNIDALLPHPNPLVDTPPPPLPPPADCWHKKRWG